MKERIGDICTLKSGTSLKEDLLSSTGKYPYVKVSDMNLVGNERYISSANTYVDAVSEKMVFPEGTILFPKRGGAIGTNKKRIAGRKVCADLNTMGVIPGNRIRPLFLYYYFKNIDFGTLYNGSSVPQINNNDIAPMEIDLPILDIQDRIITILDRVDQALQIRKQEIEKLDNLIKARFVEMFGDEKHIMQMSQVCSIITDGTHQPPKFVSDGIPFIFVSNITGNKVTYDADKYIDQRTYDELIKRTPIEIGDVLLSTVGSYGHPAVVKTNKKFLFQRHIAYLKPRKEIIDSDFLHGAILSPDGQRQIEDGVKGIAQKTLNLSEIKKMTIPVPDLIKQKAFATFVAQINKTKSAIQKSLDETQLLFDSLMQQYFG